MKIIAIIVATLLFHLLVISSVFSQQPVSFNEEGYWVVESNIYVKKQATIRFYSNDNRLIYEEKITGQKLRINQRKTRRCLRLGLAKAILAYKECNAVVTGKNWVASLLAAR
ncbi:hypothetical protein [Foetidibacter luteolus]|uniref:hypothetical protein n=1 Tax=Foetidibacter luteolus TaxID=2608880 RepID=UPI00129A76A0|nr:hypothetical protein [Foetidibacter luteolus]